MVDISAGNDHSCAVTSDGAAWCWGHNLFGTALGIGETDDRTVPVPVQVSGLTDVASISAGNGHSCAVTSAGAAWCWGAGGHFQLGHGQAAASDVPVRVVGPEGDGHLTGVTDISANNMPASSAGYTCAATSDGSAWCWGSGGGAFTGGGWLGHQPTSTFTVYPTRVLGPGGSGHLTGVVSISTGAARTCAVTSDGAAWCWGAGRSGQLGHGSTPFSSLLPVPVFDSGS